MLEFRTSSISDKSWTDELLGYSDYRSTEYCFTSIFIWQDVYNSSIARYKDWLLVRSLREDDAYYFFPAGRGDLKEVLLLMMEDARSLGKNFHITALSEKGKNIIEEYFSGDFIYSRERNTFDYIYDTQSLITLSGKKYQSKRNHIARFTELPDWKYEAISYQDSDLCLSQIEECRTMNEQWCLMNGCIHNLSMNHEKCAVTKAMDNFIALKLKGGLLRVNGKVVAFTFGEKINSDTFIVHIEKAFSDVNGAYPMINRLFLTQEATSCKYVNREDDAGDEGLRKAKLSYHPTFLLEKFYALKK